MAAPTDEALIAVSLRQSLPNYLTAGQVQNELRDVIDLITLLAPTPQDSSFQDRGPFMPDPDSPRVRDDDLWTPGARFEDDPDLQGLDPALVSRVLTSRTVTSRLRPERPARTIREPTLRQRVARRRGRTQHQVEITELRYGSDWETTLQTTVPAVAFVLLLLPYLWASIGNVRLNSAANRSDRQLIQVRTQATLILQQQLLPHLNDLEGEEAIEQAFSMIERIDEIRTAKPPPPDLFPPLPPLPQLPQLPGAGGSTPTAPLELPPGAG